MRAARPASGTTCPDYERCFITEMRRKALESDIIIVNHHLFFADLAIKLQAKAAPDAGVLPEAAAVIFDEAHELEDIASSYFGISLSNVRFEEMARDIETMLRKQAGVIPVACRQQSRCCASARACCSRCCRKARMAAWRSVGREDFLEETMATFISARPMRCIGWRANSTALAAWKRLPGLKEAGWRYSRAPAIPA